MKKILIINPNSSEKMTEDIRKTAQQSETDVQIEVIRMAASPVVLESFCDYTLAGREIITYLKENDVSAYDGILLACFGDPCLYALKENVSVPVIGIAEAAFSRALLTGYKFSVLAASEKAVPMMESMIDTYGLQGRNAGTLTLHTNIEEFLHDADKLKQKLLQAITEAKQKEAETVIYGCAGMTMVSKTNLMEQTGISIIDPIVSGISTLSAMISDGDKISKAGLYQ